MKKIVKTASRRLSALVLAGKPSSTFSWPRERWVVAAEGRCKKTPWPLQLTETGNARWTGLASSRRNGRPAGRSGVAPHHLKANVPFVEGSRDLCTGLLDRAVLWGWPPVARKHEFFEQVAGRHRPRNRRNVVLKKRLRRSAAFQACSSPPDGPDGAVHLGPGCSHVIFVIAAQHDRRGPGGCLAEQLAARSASTPW